MQDRGKKFIRDIIYEYVFFTDIESHVVEHPAFQRLRFVLQNSSAYLTYPSNQLTRFSHSLGVAHIGGKMLISALENAPRHDLVKFINDSLFLIKKEIEKLNLDYSDLLEEWRTNSVVNNCNFSRIIHSNDFTDEELYFTIDIIWQSLRLTCLTHDIGHFPFSHIFETGLERFDDQVAAKEGENSKNLLLESFINRCVNYLEVSIHKPKPNQEHEFFGAYIIKKITEDKRSTNKLLSLCLEIALNIFMIEKASNSSDRNGVYACLSSIVASDIDADRIDYTLRDARSSGLNVGNFDFSRLLNHTVLAYIKEKDTNYFKILVTEKSLSSIEQFFNYRYLLYEYIYYHHNVAKYDGLLVEILSKVLQKSIIDKDKNILSIVCRYEFVHKGKKGFELFNLNKVEIYDDSWLRAMLLELWRTENNDTSFKAILETFLFRKKTGIFSLLKRPSEYDNLIKELYAAIKLDGNLFNRLAQHLINSKKGEEKTNIEREIRKLLAQPKLNKDIESIIKSRNSSSDYSIVYKQIKPKLASSDAEIFVSNNDEYNIKKCIDASPYLKNLSQITQTSMNFYFGCVLLSSSTKVTVEEFKSEVISILIEAIKGNI